MASLGYNVTLHRTLAFGIGSLIAASAASSSRWWSGQLSPSDIGLQATIELLVIAVIGGLTRIEGAWLGAFAYIGSTTRSRTGSPRTACGDRRKLQHGDRPRFLAIVIASPDGLMGFWDRIWKVSGRGGSAERPALEASSSAASRRRRRKGGRRRPMTTGNGIHQVHGRHNEGGQEMRRPKGGWSPRASARGSRARHDFLATSALGASGGRVRVAVMTRLQGRLRVRLRARHRRRQDRVRTVRRREGEEHEEAVRRLTGRRRAGRRSSRRLRLRRRHPGDGAEGDPPADAAAQGGRDGRAALGRRGGRDRELGEATARPRR